MLCTRNTAITLVMALTLLVGMAFVSPVSAQPRTAHDGAVRAFTVQSPSSIGALDACDNFLPIYGKIDSKEVQK